MLDYVGEYREIPDDVADLCDLVALGGDSTPANQLAGYIRKVGRDRARPVVLGEELIMLGHRDRRDLHPLEELVLKTFTTTLCDIDDFDRRIDEELAAYLASLSQPYKVPLEETTHERVDGAFDTTM